MRTALPRAAAARYNPNHRFYQDIQWIVAMMKLYSYYRSSCAYRARLALHFKGIPFEYIPVHLVRDGGEQHKPEYKALNPQALVPTLIDGDFILTQSMAIMEYLEEKFPAPALLPQDTAQRAYVRQISLVNVADIHPINNLKVLNHLTGDFGVTQAQKLDWYQKWIRQGFDALEVLISRSPFYKGSFVCGDAPTMADMCLVPQIYNARRYEMDVSAWPVISAVDAACAELPAFVASCPENQPDTPDDQRPNFMKGKAS